MYDCRMASDLTRLTVNLTPTAADDLKYLCASTRLGKTDVVDRALRAYAWLEHRIADDYEMLIRPKGGGMDAAELVTFL